MTARLRKLYTGCYRLNLPNKPECFGQVRREGHEWLAEVRDSKTGNLRCLAGLWTTRTDAIDEILSLQRWEIA